MPVSGANKSCIVENYVTTSGVIFEWRLEKKKLKQKKKRLNGSRLMKAKGWNFVLFCEGHQFRSSPLLTYSISSHF